MFRLYALSMAALAAFLAFSDAARAQPAGAPPCSQSNVACQCSYKCCGEERCDGSVCSSCVVDCVRRQQPNDTRAVNLRSRCSSIMTRGFKRP
jgi:hypothetical protein